MKNKILLFSSLLAGLVLFVVACSKTEDPDSVAQIASTPYLLSSNLEDVYIYGEGNTTIYTDLPDTIGIAVDTIYGFEGGYGGKTGSDTIVLLRTDAIFGDTVSAGGSTFTVQRFNRGGYRVTVASSIVIAGANDNPGPTALEGVYKRPSNGYLLTLVKIADGIYLLDNPGGAATIPPNPYLLYNYRSVNGLDSLSFANQTDLCHGGTQLVGPAAPPGLPSETYTEQFPPELTPAAPPAPLTLRWVVFSFPSTDPEAIQGPVCNWGPAVRVFERQ